MSSRQSRRIAHPIAGELRLAGRIAEWHAQSSRRWAWHVHVRSTTPVADPAPGRTGFRVPGSRACHPGPKRGRSSFSRTQLPRHKQLEKRAASPLYVPLYGSFYGFSLLEVLLALAILAGALAALGEVMRLGDQNAALARDESEAEMLANSVVSELLSGSRQVQSVTSATFDMMADPAWTYSITVDNTDYNELVSVRVSVSQQLAAERHPAHCELVRWMPNPDYVPPDTSQQSSTNGTSTNSSSSGSSGSGGSSSTGGR
jgi:type II secretion system protein I